MPSVGSPSKTSSAWPTRTSISILKPRCTPHGAAGGPPTKKDSPKALPEHKEVLDAFKDGKQDGIQAAKVAVATLESCDNIFAHRKADAAHIVIQDESSQRTGAMSCIPIQRAIQSGGPSCW